MSFGQQWLTDWEDQQEAKHTPDNPPPPTPPVSLREIVQDEVSRYLALHLARELTDRIMIHMVGK